MHYVFETTDEYNNTRDVLFVLDSVTERFRLSLLHKNILATAFVSFYFSLDCVAIIEEVCRCARRSKGPPSAHIKTCCPDISTTMNGYIFSCAEFAPSFFEYIWL